jgi:hypothetical protein
MLTFDYVREVAVIDATEMETEQKCCPLSEQVFLWQLLDTEIVIDHSGKDLF